MKATFWLAVVCLIALLQPGCPFNNDDDDGECCGEECYPDPGDATTVLYVNPTCAPPGEDSDGSLAKPYSLLLDAMEDAPEGATVLLPEGEIKTLGIIANKPVTVLGMGYVDDETGEYVDRTYLRPILDDVGTFVIVRYAHDVTVRGVTIEQAETYGIWVDHSSNVEIRENHVAGFFNASGDTEVSGLVVSDSEDVALKRNHLAYSTGMGISMYGSTGSINGNRVTGVLDAIQVINCPPFANEAQDEKLAGVAITDNILDDNLAIGVTVLNSIADLDGNTISGTKPHPTLEAFAGDGILVGALPSEDHEKIFGVAGRRSLVSIGSKKGNTIADCARAGALITSQTHLTRFSRNQVNNNLGGGLSLLDNAVADSVDGNTFDSNSLAAISLFLGSSAVIGGETEDSANVITNTQGAAVEGMGEHFEVGDGIALLAGTKATVRFNRVLNSARAGIVTDRAAPNFVLISNNMVDGGEYDIVVQSTEDIQIPAEKVTDNFSNVFADGVCGLDDCPSPAISDVIFHYGPDKLIEVMEPPSVLLPGASESPCMPPRCTD